MIYKAEKARFFKILINKNVPDTEFYEVAHKHAVAVPEPILQTWKKKFYLDRKISYPMNPRLINRFSIGADPEFIFKKPITNEYIYASAFKLGTTMAFGADICGRQAELRAYPSRFVLEVVASLMDTLKWMAYCTPRTLSHLWVATGHVDGDGCGGHIHFGRKRFSRNQEIKSLDSLSLYLMNSNSLIGGPDRKINTRYGKANDYRITSYGYEYRGISTWLNTPFLAYLTLTLAKLSIFHDLSNAQMERFNDITFVENILAVYRYQDDDANIALKALRLRGSLKVPTILDMKTSWGIPTNMEKVDNTGVFIPPIIPPNSNTKEELFQHLINNTKLENSNIQPTWAPFKLKSNENLLSMAPHRPGLSEVCQGLISHDILIKIDLSNERSTTNIRVPPTIMSTRKFRTLLQINSVNLKGIRVVESNNKDFVIELPLLSLNAQPNSFQIDPNRVEVCRKFLLSGVFPIVDYKDYYKPYKTCIPVPEVKRKFVGKLL